MTLRLIGDHLAEKARVHDDIAKIKKKQRGDNKIRH